MKRRRKLLSVANALRQDIHKIDRELEKFSDDADQSKGATSPEKSDTPSVEEKSGDLKGTVVVVEELSTYSPDRHSMSTLDESEVPSSVVKGDPVCKTLFFGEGKDEVVDSIPAIAAGQDTVPAPVSFQPPKL